MSRVPNLKVKGESFDLPSVYPITDTRISGLTHLDQVERLIDGGATLIQLREKYASSREFHEQAVECVHYAHSNGVKIMINDRVDIAMMSDADGVHLGQDDMPPEAARGLLGPDKIIGYSTHSIEQAVAAAASGVDYVAIGPVFATGTKTDPDPVVGIEGVAKARAAISDFPLVAIGGIDMSNVTTVLSAGANSAAVISAVLQRPDEIAVKLAELIGVSMLNDLQK